MITFVKTALKTIWLGIRQRLVGTALVLDEEGNVLLGGNLTAPAGGNAHYTISQRLAEMRKNGSNVGCVGCKILTWIQNHWPFSVPGDHCDGALSGMPWSIDSVGMNKPSVPPTNSEVKNS